MLLAATVVCFGLALTPAPQAPSSADSAPAIAEVPSSSLPALLNPPNASNPANPENPENQASSQDQDPVKKPDTADEKKPPTPPHTGIHALFNGVKEDVKNLPSKQNLYLALIGGALAAGAHPFDQTFNVRLRSHYNVVNKVFAPAKYYGDTPEQVALSLGTYAFGRIYDKPKVSHLGMDLLRAQILSEILVEPIKFATHRLRPDGSNHLSFPSGHAAVTFAAATVIERHLGWKNSVLAYAIASYVAASRLHDNVHYLSDVMFGAAVGSIAGRTVTEHGREVWTFAPAAVPGGMAIFASRRVQ